MNAKSDYIKTQLITLSGDPKRSLQGKSECLSSRSNEVHLMNVSVWRLIFHPTAIVPIFSSHRFNTHRSTIDLTRKVYILD